MSSGFSFKSSQDMTFLWSKQFPDSPVAQQTSCNETKCMYLTVYGIAPYFKKLMLRNMENEPFVLMFDESLNEHLQKKQLDIIVRYWHHDMIRSRYFSSEFLGHAKATDVLDVITSSIECLGLSRLVQISMDGPNVNWSFHAKISNVIQEDHGKKLLNIGSCGLHTMHNAFKAGARASEWDLMYFLTSLYTLFDNVPARREDYLAVTKGLDGTGLFPMKQCNHRWLENSVVAQRALDMLPAQKGYLKAIKDKRITSPGTKTFENVKTCCDDKLLEAKLASFVSISNIMEPFLAAYQTDGVVFPYLANDLHALIKKLMKRFMKVEDQSVTNLIQTDLNENNFAYSKIDTGFVAEQKAKDLLRDKKFSDHQVMAFKMEAKAFVKTIVKHLLEKCPLKYRLLRCLVALDPQVIIETPSDAVSKFKNVAQCLVEAGRLNAHAVDKILESFSDFVESSASLPAMKNHSRNDRLETLYFNVMCSKYPSLWEVVRQVLLLSHGQAAVERGFSLNKAVSRENQLPESLVSLRLVKDHLNTVGFTNVEVSKELLTSCSSARQKYMSRLEAKRMRNLSQPLNANM